MIVPPASPVDTPSDVTSPGLTLHSSITGMSVSPAVAAASPLGARLAGRSSLELSLELLARHLVEPEGREELAQDPVGREVPELELVEDGAHLVVDEPPHGLGDRDVLVGPLVHG